MPARDATSPRVPHVSATCRRRASAALSVGISSAWLRRARIAPRSAYAIAHRRRRRPLAEIAALRTVGLVVTSRPASRVYARGIPCAARASGTPAACSRSSTRASKAVRACPRQPRRRPRFLLLAVIAARHTPDPGATRIAVKRACVPGIPPVAAECGMQRAPKRRRSTVRSSAPARRRAIAARPTQG